MTADRPARRNSLETARGCARGNPANQEREAVMDKVRMTLAGVDGNAFALLGAFRRAASEQGWADEAVEAVAAEAMSADYAHLVATLMANIDDDRDDSDGW